MMHPSPPSFRRFSLQDVNHPLYGVVVEACVFIRAVKCVRGLGKYTFHQQTEDIFEK